MSTQFQRMKEDFICAQCGARVSGDGYTNHCPVCLWSKHVDVYPGDRASSCGGLMCPETMFVTGSERTITHRCVVCGHKKNNRVASNDNEDALIALLVPAENRIV
ncbi:MAG: RNHCP domain-containing protein [Candidatus Yonathbacteria bacterium]|nr:RNHCP domain-containing protein [Candidatus Yonathbacteria bacterium]